MFTHCDLLEATSGTILSGGLGCGDSVYPSVSIDSRTVGEATVFFALRGPRFDGHDFLGDAMEKALCAVVEHPVYELFPGRAVVLVDDSLKALQRLAAYIRKKHPVQLAAVTGSCGKTTTKEMLAAILQKKFKVLKTPGNLNNHIGLPLTLSAMSEEDAAVVEMGASIPGDIKTLCEIALPDYGIITNVGPAHLEGFGSLEKVRETKLELMDHVGKAIIVNGDDDFLMKGVTDKQYSGPAKRPDTRSDVKVITFAVGGKGDFTASVSGDKKKDSKGKDFTIGIRLSFPDGEKREIGLRTGGMFNVYNALAACACGYSMGVAHDDIAEALDSFRGVAMRFDIRQRDGATILFDVYNANPASMAEAVKELVRLRHRRAIAVLGDMLELGAYSEEKHRELGEMLAKLPVDAFIAVGTRMETAYEAFIYARGKSPLSCHFDDTSSAKDKLADLLSEGDTVLIKGSRGLKMERIMD
ncbi:MAG: UDP-N-acetylmuramoyl-tripeptide--D-alanyl-D-alanine ligase [Nitrospirae bacterium]|nr:UDP-N-acetylmuramoyl-tripeptide--D-alanyl-D-alanine ligase [Nitrospirota bacterium]